MKTLIHDSIFTDSCPTSIITTQGSATEKRQFLDYEFAAFENDSETAVSDSVTKCYNLGKPGKEYMGSVYYFLQLYVNL